MPGPNPRFSGAAGSSGRRHSRSRSRERRPSPSRRRSRSRSPPRREREERRKSRSPPRRRSPPPRAERKRSRSRERGTDRDKPEKRESKANIRAPILTQAESEAIKASAQKKMDAIQETMYLEVDPTKNEKKNPLSVEDVMKQRQVEEDSKSKPVFLTKQQRAEAAMEKRRMEVEEQRQRQAAEREAREAEERAVRQKREEERRARTKEVDASKQLLEPKIIAAIKNEKMGLVKAPKKIMKPSDKFKFSFDWELTDDTSQDINPLYQTKHNVTLSFGRGKFAGVDRELQEEQATYYTEIVEKRLQQMQEDGQEMHLDGPEKARAERRKANLVARDRHWSDKNLEQMTVRDWRIFREDHNIATKGGAVPNPIRNWDDLTLLGVDERIAEAIRKVGYEKPSPIQMQAIPIGLQLRDIIGLAETGSGKTCAFVIPMLHFVSKLPPMTEANAAEGPYAIVLAPTRELAQQIEGEARKFAGELGYNVHSVVGGQSIEEQGFQLRRGVEILIATPGRLNDMLERRYVVLSQCTYVVMDEADRMIDLGFEPQIQGILDALPVTNMKPDEDDEEKYKAAAVADKVYRQTVMFSATMPPSVERLARKFLRHPATVIIGQVGRTVDKIEQLVEWSTEAKKKNRLLQILDQNRDGLFIVFCNTKSSVNNVAKLLEKGGHHCTVLHGGKNQDERQDNLELFRQGAANVLVATDVAGRGIDVQNVTHVINYDMAKNIEYYTHRIGRTGRAGASGTAITFITEEDRDVFYDLKQSLTETGARIPPELAKHEASSIKPGTVTTKRKREETLFCN